MVRLFRRLFAGTPEQNGAGDASSAAERNSRRLEEMLRSVVDNVIDGIITIDERGNIQSFNPAAQTIFRYDAHEVIGRNVKMLMPEPDRSRHDAYLASYLATAQAKIIGIGREVVGQRRDGSVFPMELAISEFRIGPQRFFTGIVRDITERKNLENELRKRLKELAEADQRKDQFIGLLGHELRNPLAPVRNGLQILRRAQSRNDVVEQTVSMMERQVAQMVRLIDDLLDVSRITSGKIELRRETIDLASAVGPGIETVRGELDAKKQQLSVTLPAEPVLVYADPVRIAQIVTNLLSNAVKYTEQQGRIVLCVDRRDEIGVITVRDSGIGIPQEKLDSIFEIFVQLDPSMERRQGGLGLGLTLVKSLAELHGGSVSVRSEGAGRGSEFTVRIPLAVGANPSSGDCASPSKALESRRVLVIDDNADSADSLAALLKMLGHDVRTAYSGEAGLREASAFAPDVVLCDIGMPGMSGFEVAERLRARFRAKPLTLVAATGYGRPEDVEKAKAAGFDTHLVKPVDLNRLEGLLRAAPKLAAPS